MKNIVLTLSILLLPTFVSASNNPFNGAVKYELSYDGEGADYMNMVSFEEAFYYFGDKKVRLNLSGGMAYILNDFIFNQETKKTVMIDDVNMVVYAVDDYVKKETKSATEVTVEKTKEKERIMGYKCTKYIVTEKTDSTEAATEYWTTTNINVNSDTNIGLVNALTFPGMEGFPLRIIWSSMGLTMTQEATYISTDPPNDSKFEIPSNYAVKDFSESPLMQNADD